MDEICFIPSPKGIRKLNVHIVYSFQVVQFGRIDANAVYLDDLILELRQLGLGCHMFGLWTGAVGFADDLLLMAPSRDAMAAMLDVCEQYAERLNLFFSTDVDPAKLKSKCIFVTGTRLRNVTLPTPLKLYGQDLPWVNHATHLGHELHKDGNMDYDCKLKRGRFIDCSTDIRETFKFVNPPQILKTVQVYCCDMYGSMLWNLYGKQSEQFFRCWNTCTKLSWDLPRSTHTYFVDSLLSCGMPSTRQQALNRYVKFFRSLLSSPSKEVAIIARVIGQNASTNTGKNLLNISLETNLSTWSSPLSIVNYLMWLILLCK